MRISVISRIAILGGILCSLIFYFTNCSIQTPGIDQSSTGLSGGTGAPNNVTYLPPSTVTMASISAAHPSTLSRTGISCVTCHATYNSTNSIAQFDHTAIASNNLPAGVCIVCHSHNSQVASGSSTITAFFEDGGAAHITPSSINCNTSGCHGATNSAGVAVSAGGTNYPVWSASTGQFTGGNLGAHGTNP